MSLSTYIETELASFKDFVGWASGTDTIAVSTATLEKYGVATEAEATDLLKLHAIADVCTWGRALKMTAQKYKFSADGATFDVNQVYDHILALYENAFNAAIVYLDSYKIDQGEWNDQTQDPYSSVPYGNFRSV
jgi:hypothetical protein